MKYIVKQISRFDLSPTQAEIYVFLLEDNPKKLNEISEFLKLPSKWKLGDRVKVNKIIVTVKHLESQQVEEGEFDIEAIEKELTEKRHYTSTNRWVPVSDVKNGYVISSRHISLISGAIALEYITF